MSGAVPEVRRVKTKRRSEENKENEAPQLRAPSHVARTSLSSQQGLQDMSVEATPMPLDRTFLEETPELSLPSPPMSQTPLNTQGAKPTAPLESFMTPPLAPVVEGSGGGPDVVPTIAGLEEAVMAVRGLAQLAPLDFYEGELPAESTLINLSPMQLVNDEPLGNTDTQSAQVVETWGQFLKGELPVKNTFLHFATVSPATRAVTKKLSGDSCPKWFAPGPFNLYESESPPVEKPVKISLQESLAPSVPQPAAKGASGRRIQLNLSVWIPPSKQSSGAPEPPQRVSLADHLAPLPHSASLPATVQHTDAHGDPVRRRLFEHHSV